MLVRISLASALREDAFMRIVRSCACFAIAVVTFIVATPSAARADGFLSGLIGYNFGGAAGCPTLRNCDDKRANLGVSVGSVGVIGFEEELAYAKDFFGKTDSGSSSVLTLMSNLLIAPGFGVVHPYVTGGVGLMRSHTDFTPSSLVTDVNDNQFAWDVGGGVMVFAGHVGVRGDIRHFHSFQDTGFLGFLTSGSKLDFGRASGAIVLKF
jgi:opacity protein-like surface antigen